MIKLFSFTIYISERCYVSDIRDILQFYRRHVLSFSEEIFQVSFMHAQDNASYLRPRI